MGVPPEPIVIGSSSTMIPGISLERGSSVTDIRLVSNIFEL